MTDVIENEFASLAVVSGNSLIPALDANLGIVRPISIDDEMRGAYLDYAMSVIVARALPDARDGMKPVQRRILFAMHDMGLRPGTPYKKSARIVGEVLGKYHPHGDSAVYEAMARMAQDFSLRYPLVDGQGNFGSIDGDSPAAMRYTEARLARIADALLADIDKETIDWSENFDGSLQEPSVLPGLLPNLLLNGASGIAVGMATNVPPHNLTELADAIIYLIDHWEGRDEVTVDDLMQFVQGPDFPTGGLVLGRDEIKLAYGTGKGRLIMRAVARIEEMTGGRHRIVVTEIPYQINKTTILERIAELVRDGRLNDISDLRDESDRKGMHIVIELKRGAAPRKALNNIFKYTPLQSTFGVNMLALVADEDGRSEPRLLSLKRALEHYVEHRIEVITRRTAFLLRQARERAHILEGLRIALQFLDEVIQIIRTAANAEDARQKLIARFLLSEKQAQAILDLQLRRLAALERQKIEDEYNALLGQIAFLEALLADPSRILGVIKDEVAGLKEKFGDVRRTQIVAEAAENFSEEDLIRQEEVLISVTQGSYIKRTPLTAYRSQKRGGRGVQGMKTKAEDEVIDLFSARTLDHVLFFTNRGRVYGQRVFALPDAARDGKGLPMVNVLNLTADERVTTLLVVPDFEQAEYVTLLTRLGRIKRIKLEEFEGVRPSGIIAMNLEPGDELGWARATGGTQEFIIVTAGSKALRFAETAVRPMGRSAAGVLAMQLAAGDVVATFDVVEPGGDLLVLTEHGYGKRTPLIEYPVHGRNTGGQWTLAHTRLDETGKIAAAHVVQPEDQVSIITSNGIALRTPVAAISQMSRMTRGVRIVNLDGNDTVAAMARLAAVVEEGVEQDEKRKTKERRPATTDRGQQTVEQSEGALEGESGEAGEAELAVVGDGAEE
ncbi:MAG: DNA gyrase subunit A [Chloroflexi bacterium]|nr:DNA gyrase subunit A [Chloroflexota bacterium]